MHISVLIHLWATFSTWEVQAEAEQSGGPCAGSSLPPPASPQAPALCSPRLGSAPGTWHCSHPPSARVSPRHFCTSLQGTPLLCSQHWFSLSPPSSSPSPKYSSAGMGNQLFLAYTVSHSRDTCRHYLPTRCAIEVCLSRKKIWHWSRPAGPELSVWALQGPFHSPEADCQHRRLSRPHQTAQGQNRKSVPH